MSAADSFALCPLSGSDIAAVAALHAASFSRGWSAADMAEMLVVPGTFGVLAAQEAGFILCRESGEACEILTLAVAVDHRRRGIGAVLLEAGMAEAKARGAARMVLDVSEMNEAARRLYARAGFTMIHRRPDYYRTAQRHEDALVMECVLV